MMQPLERRRGIVAAVAAILIAGFAARVGAAVLCGRRNAATAEIADGATLKLRTACRSNELPVNAADLGLQPASGFVVRAGNTVTTNGTVSTAASCEAGEIATGGGILALGNDGGAPVMRSSRPQPDAAGSTPTGWRTTEANSAGTGTITVTAYAVCAVP
jgi:hypothetical protein